MIQYKEINWRKVALMALLAYVLAFCFRAHEIPCWDNPNYKLESSYGINGVDYTDDGKNYDVKANDQIYTSVLLTKNPFNNSNLTDLSVFLSQEFEHHTQLNTYAVQAELIIRVRCKIRHTFTGLTILGFSCSKPPGCIEFYDCEAEIEWEW